MQLLTVKNRSDEPFAGMYDGVVYTVPPRGQLTLLSYIARHIKNQSVFLDNPITGEKEFRLAIAEDGDEVAPLAEEQLPVESFNRLDMDLNKVRIVRTNTRPAVPMHRDNAGSAHTSKERQG